MAMIMIMSMDMNIERTVSYRKKKTSCLEGKYRTFVVLVVLYYSGSLKHSVYKNSL